MASLCSAFTHVLDQLPQTLGMMPEPAQRQLAGMYADAIGRGGVTAVANAAGMARNTVAKGRDEWLSGNIYVFGNRQRKEGGGRKSSESIINDSLAGMQEEEIRPKISNILGRNLMDTEDDRNTESADGTFCDMFAGSIISPETFDDDIVLDTIGDDTDAFGTCALPENPMSGKPHSSILVFPASVGIHDEKLTAKQRKALEKAYKKALSEPTILLPDSVRQKYYPAPPANPQDGLHILLPPGVRLDPIKPKSSAPVKKGTGKVREPRKPVLILPDEIQVKLYGAESLGRNYIMLTVAGAEATLKQKGEERKQKKLPRRISRHLSRMWAMEDEYEFFLRTGLRRNRKGPVLYIPGLHRTVQYDGIYYISGGTEYKTKPEGGAAAQKEMRNRRRQARRRAKARRIQHYASYTNENRFPPDFNFRSIKDIIELIVISDVYGDPMSGRKYSKLTAQQFCDFVKEITNDTVSASTMLKMLRKWGISLHVNQKLFQVGKKHCQTDEQMKHIRFVTDYFMERQWTVLSLDAKAKISLGNFAAKGREWTIQGYGRVCNDHDFFQKFRQVYPNGSQYVPKELMNCNAVCTPFCVYCVNDNTAHVEVGINSDTSEFAGHALHAWWDHTPWRHNGNPILLLMDGGGSNRCRGVEWKYELARFADYTGVPVYACHYPSGKSKYNPCERMLWGMASQLWAGQPLYDLETVRDYFLQLGENYGPTVTCEIDSNIYKTKTRKEKEYKAAKAKADKKNQCNKDGDKIVVKRSDYIVNKEALLESWYIETPIHNALQEDDAMPMWNYIVCPREAPEDSATDGQKETVQAKPTLPAGNLKQEPQAETLHTTTEAEDQKRKEPSDSQDGIPAAA